MDRSLSADEDRVESLVAQCLERAETDGAGAVDAVCARHPELARAVRDRLAALDVLGLVGAAPAAADGGFPEQLGEFRLLRRLGGGGMGVVYLAEQSKLGRRVALKLIRPEHLYFPGARERFRREVEAVARLQHPGIVPVYTVGEENGVPYFAMERVEGCSLADVIEEVAATPPERLTGSDFARAVGARSGDAPRARESDSGVRVFEGSWVETCLRVMSLVAEALEHAHSRGVLHRDVKPSNVMVTPLGRVMLLDFGLASTDTASKLTQSGAFVGSLPFMAPEQVRGETGAIDARTDVYALGITLYELLALRVPYAAASAEETRQKIVAGRPAPIRAANPSVPWDAETVCLTAMERDPPRRYASAGALARDLRNVLELRPIDARRAGPWLRGRRWAQRHPALAASIALGALVVIGGPLGFGLQERSARREEARLRGVAEANADLAMGAVDQMLTRVGERRLAEEPHMEALRRELLEDALRFEQRLLDVAGPSPKARRETALAYQRVGSIHSKLGAYDEAERALAKAVELFDALRAESPADARARHDLAHAHNERGLAFYARRRLREAAASWEATLAISETLAAERLDDVQARLDLASALLDVGIASAELGEVPRAEAVYRRGVDLLGALAKETADRADVSRALANANLNLGKLQLEKGDVDGAATSFRDALDRFDRAGATDDAPAADRDRRAKAAELLARTHLRRGRFAAAEALTRETLAAFRALVRDFPSVGDYRFELLAVLNDLGLQLKTARRFDDSLAAFDEAAAAVASAPRELRFREVAASIGLNRAVLLEEWGRLDGARDALLRAADDAEALASEHPEFTKGRDLAARVQNILGVVLAGLGDGSGAERAYRASIAHFDDLSREFQNQVSYARTSALIRNNLAWLLEEQGDRSGAIDLLSEAVASIEQLPDDVRATVLVRRELALHRRDLGQLLERRGDLDDAERVLEEALAAHRALRAGSPADAPLREEMSGALAIDQDIRDDELAIAEVKVRRGDAREARAFADRAVAAAAGDDESWEAAASVYARCAALDAGDAAAARDDRARALDALGKAIAAGFHAGERLRASADFDALRGSAEFEALVERATSASRPSK